jgi:hypothetical protein
VWVLEGRSLTPFVPLGFYTRILFHPLRHPFFIGKEHAALTLKCPGHGPGVVVHTIISAMQEAIGRGIKI